MGLESSRGRATSREQLGESSFRGHPGGPLGALLAGILGWLAATATIQTGGIAWAWSLHVILDVVILTVVLAIGRVPLRSRAPGIEVAS